MVASTRRLRAGLLGYGHGGRVFHAPLLAASPDFELAAVVTRDPARRAELAARHPGVRALDAADDLWAMAGELDLAVVATPNRTHVPLARAALAAGLPVVVDKPLAPTSAAARELAADAAVRGRLCSVFQNRRWDGDFLTVQRVLASGELGAPSRFESRYERFVPALKGGWRERGDPDEAGGLLFDLGAHLVDQALVLFGPAVRVYAELDRRRPGAEVDDDAFVALTHASGVRSHLWMSKVAAQRGPRFRLLGERAAFTKAGMDPQEALLAAGAAPGGPGWGEDPPERQGRVGCQDGTERAVPTEPGDYPRYYALLAAALRGQGPPPVTLAEAVAALQAIEAARRSAAAGVPVAPGPG